MGFEGPKPSTAFRFSLSRTAEVRRLRSKMSFDPPAIMLAFIVPLQSRQASKDWAHVCALVGRTLRSLLAQKHPDFRVFLVCNEVPNDCLAHPSLTIIQRSFPLPDMSKWENRMTDKWSKVRVGTFFVRDLAPCHIMVVDADDCVSSHLSEYCAEYPDSHGWIFDQGWIHDEGSRFIFRKRHSFDSICGTSSIVRTMPDELPVSEGDGRHHFHILRSGHTKIRANSIERGTALEPLPIPGSVYNLATGENHTSFSLHGWRSKSILSRKLLSYRLLTRRIRDEFGLYDFITR